jgi:hypothetical protein
MTPITPDLARRLDEAPDSRHDVIVLTAGSIDDLLAGLPPGVEVRHVYRLRKGIAARASAGDVRALAKVAGVTSVEPDRPVKSTS